MVNFNGILQESAQVSLDENRGFLYGDAVFETLKVVNGKVLFLEDHYFRLMASLRILRMEIPMNFTMEFMQEEIQRLLDSIALSPAYRVRFTCYRQGKGLYFPENKNIVYVVQAQALTQELYAFSKQNYEIELFKDFYLSTHLLSSLKTTSKLISITASIFAQENGYQNCLLLNENKEVAECINGNLFVVNKNEVITPPIGSGCVNGIMRKQVIALLEKHPNFQMIQRPVSVFELQKADELFLTNVISGIQPVTKYRKKTYTANVAFSLQNQLNAQIRLI